MTKPAQGTDAAFVRNAVEATIRIVVIAALAVWCFSILRPFIPTVVWAAILAIALQPLTDRVRPRVGDRAGLAAAVVALGTLVVVAVPTYFLLDTLWDGVDWLRDMVGTGQITIPAPSAAVAGWPLIGERLYDFWSLAHADPTAAIGRMEPLLKSLAQGLLHLAGSFGIAVLQMLLALGIAAVLMTNAKGGGEAARHIGTRLAGERGVELVELIVLTTRGVARGILGVAVIQALLVGIGFVAVGVPLAGLWTLLILVLAVVQLPPLLVVIPAILWAFSAKSTTIAVVFTIYSLLAGASDNFLKPILLGRGARVPMLVIFLGAIGGMITMGVVGLFVGSIVLAVGYTVLWVWLDGVPEEAPAAG